MTITTIRKWNHGDFYEFKVGEIKISLKIKEQVAPYAYEAEIADIDITSEEVGD